MITSLPTVVFWPLSALPEAIPLLAQHAALLPANHSAALPPLEEQTNEAALIPWLETAALQLGLEVQAAETMYPDLENLLLQGAPALLRLPADFSFPGSFVLVVAGRRGMVSLLGQDGKQHRLPVSQVRDILVTALEAPLRPTIDTMLEQLHIREQQRDRVCQHL
ncbi:MAG: hypothetical protein D3923_13230, partial [Candidatus Electrothrix sp. AR3]|nr:hypothetical protein [Candidatus Electrothrix sp. AR3]